MTPEIPPRPARAPLPSDESLPAITIVTPSFNQAAFLDRTIRSVLGQGYPNLQYIVMDGGSTDGSVDIIRRYEGQLDYWQSQADGGQTAAVNAGWARARGDIIAWLNSDDYYLDGALLFIGRYFRDHPSAGVVYGSVQLVDATGSELGYMGEPFNRRTMILSRNVIPQSSSFLRRALVEAVGPMDESLRYVMDLDLFLRIAERTRPTYIPVALSAQTVHPDAKTSKDRWPMGGERYMVRRRYARGPEALHLRLQPVQSWVYHRLPAPIHRVVTAARPQRVFTAPSRAKRPDGR